MLWETKKILHPRAESRRMESRCRQGRIDYPGHWPAGIHSGENKYICKCSAGYFGKNKSRMRYAEFGRRGMYVGSEARNAGCRSVSGAAWVQSGPHGSRSRCEPNFRPGCSLMNNRREDDPGPLGRLPEGFINPCVAPLLFRLYDPCGQSDRA